MKHNNDITDMCTECTGSGCKQCNGTGSMPDRIYINWLQGVIKRKDKEIAELESALNISLALTKGLKNRLEKLIPDRVLESAKQDKNRFEQ